MEEIACIPFAETNKFSRLIIDYLNQDPKLSKYYTDFPSMANFAKQIERKQNFPVENRSVLVDALQEQLKPLILESDLAASIQSRIDQLGNKNTYTVTTGHQLNIFTGPIFFIYKIASAIKLSQKLNLEYLNQKVLPVYWMATEDHDFEEINHIHFNEGVNSWNSDQGGAVGRFSTKDFKEVYNEVADLLGPGKNAEYLKDLFHKAYLEHSNLSHATAYIAYTLFKDYDLIVIDGDSTNLKRLFAPIMAEELTENTAIKSTLDYNKQLYNDYHSQVEFRDINLFYLGKSYRERIVYEGGKYQVLNQELSFSKEEIQEELQKYPERFSPNVVLRPLYQETILPNLAYIGGGGELAYWFQLKSVFEAYNQVYPFLVLRNSAMIIPSLETKRMESIGLEIRDLFLSKMDLKAKWVKSKTDQDPELKAYSDKIESIFDDLEMVAKLTDKSMLGAVNAQRQKQLNGIENLKKKLLRAEKKKYTIEMEKIDRIFHELFPSNSLQERHDNMMKFYLSEGHQWIDSLVDLFDPLNFNFYVLGLSKR